MRIYLKNNIILRIYRPRCSYKFRATRPASCRGRVPWHWSWPDDRSAQ